MAYAQPERDDDDAARMEWAEVKLLRSTVEKLLPLKAGMSRDERGFVADIDLRVCVLGQHPGAQAVQRVKALAWKYRRHMAPGAGPKLPPHDPIVREMEGRE